MILHVEDNDATAYLVQYAFRHQDRRVDLIRLCNGNEGSSFLGQIGIYAEAPRPFSTFIFRRGTASSCSRK